MLFCTLIHHTRLRWFLFVSTKFYYRFFQLSHYCDHIAILFCHADSFNQPIGGWNTSKVTDMNCMFLGALSFNQPVGKWNTSNVTDMHGMFSNAESFNQPIGEWNTSKVWNMGRMFASAGSFNQPIDKWNTSNVTDMSEMFCDAEKFNCPVNNPKILQKVTLQHTLPHPPMSFSSDTEDRAS